MKPFEAWVDPAKGVPMIRIDGNFMYQVGANLHPLTGVNGNLVIGQKGTP